MSDVRLSLDEVRALALRGLAASGVSDVNAAVIADVMTSAERDGLLVHWVTQSGFLFVQQQMHTNRLL